MKLFSIPILILFLSSNVYALLSPFRQLTPITAVEDVRFSADDKTILVQTRTDADVYDLNAHLQTHINSKADSGPIGEHPDLGCGNYIALEGRNSEAGAVLLYEKTGKFVRSFRAIASATSGQVNRIQFNDSCTRIFIHSAAPLTPGTSYEDFARIYDIQSGSEIYARQLSDQSHMAMVNNEFTYLVEDGWYDAITVRDIASDSVIYEYSDNGNGELFPVFISENELLTTSSYKVQLHELKNKKLIYEFDAPPDADFDQGSRFHPLDKNKVILTSDNFVYFYDLRSRTFEKIDVGFAEYIDSLCFSGDGRKMMVIGSEDDPSIVDLTNNLIVKRISIEPGSSGNCSLNSDGSAATIGSDLGARLYFLN